MAKQKIVWTVLPYGFVPDGPHAGCLRLSVVVSPRLTPQAANEQQLGAFPEFVNWPKALADVKFTVEFGGNKIPAALTSKPDPALWDDVFPASTFVDGFKFTDMRSVNLRSFAVRNVLKFVRQKYEQLATTSGADRPRLLPWRNADPALKGLLTDLGVRTEKFSFGDRQVEVAHPGFERFFDRKSRAQAERNIDRGVFSKNSVYGPPGFTPPVVGIDGNLVAGTTPVRALPPDWNPPAGGADAGVMSQFRSAAEYDFYQANRFYTRPEDRTAYERTPGLAGAAPPPKAPEFDFHRIVASFADFPDLLRGLGLVIDIALPKGTSSNALLAALAASPQAQVDGVISLLPAWNTAHNLADDAYPRTAFRLTKQRFLPRARGSELRDGLLHLEGAGDQWGKSKSDYDVYQVDPDGAALKTTDFLLTAQNLVARSLDLKSDGKVTYTTGDRQAVAALRSGSIGVSCHGRAGRAALAAAAAALKNEAFETSAAQSRKVVLFAEDVLRGYRVDVFTASTGQWNSLCRRIGTYHLTQPNRALDAKPDEGYVKGASTTSSEGSDDHYLHESLFRWAGWSLAAPRPGRTIIAEAGAGPGLQGERVGHVDDVAAANTGVVARFVAEPRSLPRLRFGERYRIRARVVDLAGNSLRHDDPSLGADEQATQEVAYLRFEPVDPPALVQRDRLSEGESLERIVIRSNFDVDPAAYLGTPAFSSAIADPPSAGFDYVSEAVRHVVPPKTAQLQAEMHRLFDQAIAGGASDARAAYELITQREPLSLFDVPGVMLVTPPSTTQATSTVLPLAPARPRQSHRRPAGRRPVRHLPGRGARAGAAHALPARRCRVRHRAAARAGRDAADVARPRCRHRAGAERGTGGAGRLLGPLARSCRTAHRRPRAHRGTGRHRLRGNLRRRGHAEVGPRCARTDIVRRQGSHRTDALLELRLHARTGELRTEAGRSGRVSRHAGYPVVDRLRWRAPPGRGDGRARLPLDDHARSPAGARARHAAAGVQPAVPCAGQ